MVSTGRYQHNQKSSKNPSYIVNATSNSDFEGDVVPLPEMPFLLNPSKGYIVTANNRIVPDNYYINIRGEFMSDARYRTLSDEIESLIAKTSGKVTFADVKERMLKITVDRYSIEFGSLVRQMSAKPNWYLEQIKDFNGDLHRESREGLLNQVLENAVGQELVDAFNLNKVERRALLGNFNFANYIFYRLRQFAKDPNMCQVVLRRSCDDFVESATRKAEAELRKVLGSEENWKYGNYYYKRWEHKPLSKVKPIAGLVEMFVRADGNRRTPKVNITKFGPNNRVGFASSNAKFLVDLADHEGILFSIDTVYV